MSAYKIQALWISRYDKPIGTDLLFIPCAWGVAAAFDPSQTLSALKYLGLFYWGSFTMRSAGCIINDMWDKDFDGKVERTKTRPLASGMLSYKQATGFLFLHLAGGLLVLHYLNWNAIALSFGIVPVMSLYPLAKRFTNYPQVVLGSCFNWGVLVGYATHAGSIDSLAPIAIYASGVLWTLIYDTIYAHQDKADDKLIGVKSTALTWGENSKTILQWLNTVNALILLTTGVYADYNVAYRVGVLGATLFNYRLIDTWDMNNVDSSRRGFVNSRWYGVIIFLSLFIGRMQLVGDKKKETASAPK